jgi:hypothetical protein
VYAVYHQTQMQVFVKGIDNLFLIATALCALGALSALLLRSGPTRATPAPASSATPKQEAAPPALTNGQLADGEVTLEHHHTPSIPTGNGSPARTTEKLIGTASRDQG